MTLRELIKKVWLTIKYNHAVTKLRFKVKKWYEIVKYNHKYNKTVKKGISAFFPKEHAERLMKKHNKVAK